MQSFYFHYIKILQIANDNYSSLIISLCHIYCTFESTIHLTLMKLTARVPKLKSALHERKPYQNAFLFMPLGWLNATKQALPTTPHAPASIKKGAAAVWYATILGAFAAPADRNNYVVTISVASLFADKSPIPTSKSTRIYGRKIGNHLHLHLHSNKSVKSFRYHTNFNQKWNAKKKRNKTKK